MDFNVAKMAAVVHVKRAGMPVAVDEIVRAYDTPDMIRQIRSATGAIETGITLGLRHPVTRTPVAEPQICPRQCLGHLSSLRAANQRHAPSANPPIKDRVDAMDAMFCNAAGERRYRVNAAKCPTYADCPEQQPYDDHGEPSKKDDPTMRRMPGAILLRTITP